jgi:hypothetical protein
VAITLEPAPCHWPGIASTPWFGSLIRPGSIRQQGRCTECLFATGLFEGCYVFEPGDRQTQVEAAAVPWLIKKSRSPQGDYPQPPDIQITPIDPHRSPDRFTLCSARFAQANQGFLDTREAGRRCYLDWREVKALADDDVRVRNLAKVLLATPGLTEKQHDFLSDMAKFEGQISSRQGETLLSMRDELREVSIYGGFSVATLIRKCWLARLDLAEDDEQFIDKLIDKLDGRSTIRRKHAGRLLRIARQLELID